MKQIDEGQFGCPVRQQFNKELEVAGVTSGVGIATVESDPTHSLSNLIGEPMTSGIVGKNLQTCYQILMVEDDCLAQWAGQIRFKKLGCQVELATTIKMALILAKIHHYDLILLDIGLPDGDGRDVARAIRDNINSPNHETPIVALTAHLHSIDEESCIAARMAQKFAKPLTEETVKIIYNSYLKEGGAARAKAKFNGKIVPILNFAMQAKSISSDRASMDGLLRQWIKSLSEEREALQEAWTLQCWSQLKESVQRLHISAGHHKMAHLQVCCAALESALADSDIIATERISALYQQLLQEIEMVLEEHPA